MIQNILNKKYVSDIDVVDIFNDLLFKLFVFDVFDKPVNFMRLKHE